ncbi:nesprin-2 [Tachysurus ichikawai]
MASRDGSDGSAAGERCIPLDIDDVQMLLQVEQEQVQKRTFTNWINAQLSKRSCTSLVQDLFADLRDGARLLDLLEVMSGQHLKREKGRGVFQQRGNIETALNFLKNKSIKLVNINIPDIIEGKPSIILGLIWTIILRCHIEELASMLSFGSRSSSLDSLSSVDSAPGTPVRGSPVSQRASPIHTRFRLSAKKALLLWVQDQCQKVGSSVSVKDFKSSWRSGIAFHAILCSLRPDLVDMSLTETRSNRENLEEAFRIAQQELGIPRLLEPEDIDVSHPDEKSIMTYVAQFLQYSNDMPTVDDDLELQTLIFPTCFSPVNLPTYYTPAVLAFPLHQASPSQKVREMTCWLQQAYEELLDVWSSTEREGYSRRYQVFQTFVGSFYEQRRPVIPMLSAMKRSTKLSEEQVALRQAWDNMEDRLHRYKTELDGALPAPLHGLSNWLQRMEAVLDEDQGTSDHASAARNARDKQEQLKALMVDMSGHLDTLHLFHNTDDEGSSQIPAEKLDELKRRFTNARVTAKYHGIKLEYSEHWHNVCEVLSHLKGKLNTWRGPYGSQESVLSLLQDWSDTIKKQGMGSILNALLHKLKETASTYTGKAALSEDSGTVNRQVKEAESEAAVSAVEINTVRGTMDRVLVAWESYKHCSHSLQVFLGQALAGSKVPDNLSKWSSFQAQLNETGNYLIEVTNSSTSSSLANELGKLNRRWADFIKRTKFAVPSQQVSSSAPGAQAMQRLVQEADWTLREAVDVSSEALHSYRKRLQAILKKISDIDLDLLSPSPGFSEETLQKLKHRLSEMRQALGEAEQACGGLQKTTSELEGRLTELAHCNTEAMEVCQLWKELQHSGHQGPHPKAKSLIGRRLQLEEKMVAEGQDLQALLEQLQENSSLPFLSVCALQGRVKHTVKHSKDIIKIFTSMRVKREGEPEGDQPPPKVIVHAYTVPEPQTGTFQEYETHTSKPKKSFPKSLTQSQQQKSPGHSQKTDKTRIKFQVFSHADPQFQPHDQPSVLLRAEDIGIKNQAFLTNPSGNVMQMELQTEYQKLNVRSSQTKTTKSSEWPQQLSESSGSTVIQSGSKSKTQDMSFNPQQHHGRLAKAHSLPQHLETSCVHVKTPTVAQIQRQTQGDTHGHTQLEISPHTPQQAQAWPKVLSPSTHQRQQDQSNAPNPRPVPEQSEVFARAHAMARSRMNKAKQLLQQHIEEVTTIFSNRVISKEQARRKQGALRRLNPAVLNEFLGAVEGVGAFCSEAQLQELERLSLSVRAQWEDVRSAIESFLPELWQEVERRQSINLALLRHDIDTNTEIPACDPDQVCSKQACSSVKEPQEHLEGLYELSNILSSPASSSVTATQFTESDGKMGTVRYQVNPSCNIKLCQQRREGALRTEPELPADLKISQAYSQDTVHTNSVETKQTAERTVIYAEEKQEVEDSLQEAYSSYNAARSAFKQQLQMNSEQLNTDFLTGSSLSTVTLKKCLQDLQVMKQKTEALWFEFTLQSSSHMKDDYGKETDRIELIEQWRGQQICFHARMRSLKSALEMLEPTDIRIKQLSDQLDQNSRKTLDITGFALNDSTAINEETKLLGEHIEREMMLLSEMERKVTVSAGSTELQAHMLLQQIIQSCTERLQLLNNRLAGTMFVIGALEHFLNCLHKLNDKVSTADRTSPLTAAPAADPRLASIREKLQQATEEAAQIDCLLKDAGMSVTLDKKLGSCQDLVASCATKIIAPEEEKRERMLRKKRKALQVTLNEVQRSMEKQGLKEATLPALQHRLRCLTDIDCKLAAVRSDIQSLRDTSAQTSTSEEGLRELEVQWEEIHKTLSESQEECLSLTELLKKFQSCHAHLNNTLRISEQTISEQASYMGRENLQRIITRVNTIKSDLSALGDGVEEFRAVCRQLHSRIRNIPDCPDAPFESEADALMDRWLDVSERTDCHFDNLQIGLSLWDKLLLLAREVESWTNIKIREFAQPHPFQTEQDVLAMQEELKIQEKNVDHFHHRSAEIKGILHSSEPPPELQVIESQMRKRMEEVKELFTETSDVYRELVAAKAQVTARMTECMSSVQMIKDALSTLAVSKGPQLIQDIQVLSEKLQLETEQADTLMQQVAMLANVANPESLLSLAEDGAQLHECISEVRNMILLKKKEAESPSKPQQVKYAQVTKSDDIHFKVTVQKIQDPPPEKNDFSNTQEEQDQSSSDISKEIQAKDIHEDSLELEDFLKDLQNFRHLLERTEDSLKIFQQSVDTQETDAQNITAKGMERLQGLQVVLDLRPEGNSRLEKLKVRSQALLQRHSEREGRDIQDVLCMLRDAESQWDSVLQSAAEQHRLLQDVMERSSDEQHQQLHLETRLKRLQEQIAALPAHFPWPGMTEKKLFVEKAHYLLEKAKALDSEVTALKFHQVQLTQDPSWTDQSWDSLENSISSLVKQISDLCGGLDESIQTERHWSLVLNQCNATLDTLQKEMLMSSHKKDQKSKMNTLEALLQALCHEVKNVHEVKILTTSLLKICTPEGQKALSQDIQTLLKKHTMLEKSINEQLHHLQRQKAAEMGFEATEREEEDVKHSNDISLEGMQFSSLMESVQPVQTVFLPKITADAESSSADADVSKQQGPALHIDSDKQSCIETAKACKTVQLKTKLEGQQTMESPKVGDAFEFSSDKPDKGSMEFPKGGDADEFSSEHFSDLSSQQVSAFSTQTADKALDAIDGRDDMEFPENTDRQLSETRTTLVGTSHSSATGTHPYNIKSTDLNNSIQKQVPNSGDISETSRAESQIITAVPLQLDFSIHAEAGSEEQAKNTDSSDCLQTQEMFKAKIGSEGDQCEGFKDNSKLTRTANQLACASALGTLLDMSRNVHSVMDTSDVPTEYKTMEAQWPLQPLATEMENQLGRAVLSILKCRYKPAQLSKELMNQQLQEAETYKQYVEEQLASQSQCGGFSQLNQNMKERWNSVLVDATATVKVKEAQLQQVTQYHLQIKAIQDMLQELEEELDSLSLVSLKSSAVQAKKLSEFLKHMDQNRKMLEDLMHTCCHLLPYLGEAERAASCVIQVKNLQKKWQILEGTADRTLRHADHCISETSILIKDANARLGELKVLQIASPSPLTQIKDCQRAIQEMITFYEFVEINEQYMYLLELSQALFQCPLGEKEKEDISNVFQNLKSQLDCVQENHCAESVCPTDHLLAEIIDTMKSWFAWAKQTESRIIRKKKLCLFPEEASQQFASMKKLQSDISSKQFTLSSVVMKLKEQIAGLSPVDSHHMLSAIQTLENVYSKISEKAENVSAELNQMLHARQRLDMQITDITTWFGSLLEKESNKAAAIQFGNSITVYQQKEKATLKEAEKRLSIIKTLLDETKNTSHGLSSVDTFHLINKLSTFQEAITGIVKCKETKCWELKEILNAQKSCTEEFTAIKKSLRQITTDLENQRYAVTQEHTLAAFVPIRHMLIEHLSQVLEFQHCQENQRKDILQTILSLQEKMRLLDQQSMGHEEYLKSKKHLENHFEAVKKRVFEVMDSSKDVDKRLHLGQTLLVEIRLVKIYCQETAEQLEAISGDLFPSPLNSDRQKIQSMLKSLAAWEDAISNDVKNQEDSLLASSFSNLRKLTPITDHFMRVEKQLKQNSCLDPSDQAITVALQTCLTLERSVTSVLRILEISKDWKAVEGYGKTTDIGKIILNDCKMQMENLLKAKEALKDYHSALRRAVGFLQKIETDLLVPSASFKDTEEELNCTQQLLTNLSKGFQEHITEFQARLPSQACFSPQTKTLHIQFVSHLYVTHAKVEAQAQLKLETIQTCLMEQATHNKQHEDINHLLQNFDANLTDSFCHKHIEYKECKDQLDKIKVLKEELVNVGTRLEDLKDQCRVLNCNVASEKNLGHLLKHWDLLQWRLDMQKSRVAHTETQWLEIKLRIKRSREALDHLQHSLSEISKMKDSHGKLQEILEQTKQLQNELEKEQLTLVSLQRYESRQLSASTLHNTLSPIRQELQSLLSRCGSLKEQSSEVNNDVLSKIQELGRFQEELKGLQQSVLSLLLVLQSQSDPRHIRKVRAEVDAQNVRLRDIMDRVTKMSKDPPREIQNLHDQITLSLKEAKNNVEQAMENSGSLKRISEHVDKVTLGLSGVEALLQQKSPTVREAESILKRLWDELDQWHSRITELEAEVQELAEEQPERAHILMDELTKPLQLYQAVAKQAEQRTAFINRIPTCLQEYEDILRSSTCWLAEAQSWLKSPQSYTTAKCLHSHVNALQMMLDESEGIQGSMEAFGPSLQEISAVYDTNTEEQNLLQIRTNIRQMQLSVLEPLSHLQHAAEEMDAIETEVKTMEKSITQIKSILSTVETEEIPPEEHLQNRQVILENLQAMQRTLAEIERCRDGLGLPPGAEISLLVFHTAEQLYPQINELHKLTEEQSTTFRAAMGHSVPVTSSSDGGMVSSLALQGSGEVMVPVETANSKDEDGDEYDDESSHSSSSETLTCSSPEDQDEISVVEVYGREVTALSITKESFPGSSERTEETKLESGTLPTSIISKTTCSRVVDADDDRAHVPVTTPETLLPLTLKPDVQLNILSKGTEETLEDIKYQETTEIPEGVTHTIEFKPKQIAASSVKHVLVCTNKNVLGIEESSIQEILTEQFKESSTKPTEIAVPALETKSDCQEDKALSTDETPGNKTSVEITTIIVEQVSLTKESHAKEISCSEKSVESVCLKTESKSENGTSSKQISIADDAVSVSATVCPPLLDISMPETTDPTVKLSMPTKMMGKKTAESLKEKPEGVTQIDALKQEQIGASTLKPGLISKDKDIVDIGTESDLQEMLEEFKSKPIEKEILRHSAVSEDQQGAVSFLTAVPILDTKTTPQKDTALQQMQRELEEQRNLIQAIAHQSSSSDLEQEDQSQSQKYERSIDGSLYVHKQPPGMEVTWDQLLYRLSLLLHSVNTEQDRTMLEVKSVGEDEVVSDTGSSIIQEMHWHVEQLQLIQHKRFTLDSPDGINQFKLCEVLSCLGHTLSRITHTLQPESEMSRETSQLHLLNLQCLSSHLASVSRMIISMDQEITLSELPDATSCLERMSSCIFSIQRSLSTQEELLSRQLGHSPQLQIGEQLLESPVSVLEAKGAQHSKSTRFTEALSSLQGEQDKVWRSMQKDQRTQQEVSALQRCYQSNLQGLRDLLELGSERLQHSQVTHQHSCSQLQALLKGHKRYFKEIRWYHTMIQYLSKQIPEGALKDQEEVEQLISALVLQALGQGIQIQHNFEERSRLEEMEVKLGKQLEELEAALPSNDLNTETEPQLRGRLQAYQQLQRLLKDSRPQLELLQAQALFPERVNHAGPISELQANWLALHRQLEQELQHTQVMQVSYKRFQCTSAELEVWIASAVTNVQLWNSLCDPNPLDSECLLLNIMNFFKELESRSVQKASAVRAGTQVQQLSDTDANEIRQHLFQLEKDWTELTNAVPSIQCALQQLLAVLGQSKVRAYLSSWLEQMKSRLEEESSREHHVLNSTELSTLLQTLKGCKAETRGWQPCIDFLNHSVEETGFVGDTANRIERLKHSEQLGALNLCWILLQREIDIKMQEIEQKMQDCAQREEHLQCLHSWISVQKKKMKVNERPTGRIQIQQALKESEEVEEMLKLKSNELLHMRSHHMLGQKDGQHPGDQTFSSQVESTSEQCQTLMKQMSAVRTVLVGLNEQWAQLDAAQRDAFLHTVSITYELECSKVPALSLQQSKEHVDHLQELQMEVERSEQTWTNLSRLFSDLEDKIHPGAAVLLSDELDQRKTRWVDVKRDVSLELQKAQMELRLWQDYRLSYEGCSKLLNQYWEQCEAFCSLSKNYDIELLHSKINNIIGLEDKLQESNVNVGNVLEASKLLMAQLEPQAATVIKSEASLLSNDLVHLSQELVKTRGQLQEELEDRVCFNTDLKSLMQCLKRSETSPSASSEHLKLALLELSARTPDLGTLNEQSLRLPLAISEAEQLQFLNSQWVQVFTQSVNRHREMYSVQLCDHSFQQKCQAWMVLLEKLESGLSTDISGNEISMRKQLALHQKLKMEVLIGQQLLDAVVTEELQILDKSQVEDRKDLILKLAQLKEQWRGTLRRVQQRSRCLEQQREQWRLYRTGLKRLWRLLKDLDHLLSPAGLAPCSFQQLQQSIKDYEQAREKLSDHEELYTQTVQLCRQILPLADVQTQSDLKNESGALQEAWEQMKDLLVKRKVLSETVIQNWSCCEDGLADSALHLREIAVRLKQPPLDNIEIQEKLIKEEENSLKLWSGGLKELVTMKTDISQYVMPTDTLLLHGQVEELHSQWEELCLKVSKRKQEIADHLNAWTIFNDKHKELCEWLAQMERKVLHSSDYFSIEEMIEKLKKDCMEEINLFSENKSHLKRLGEQLLLASDQAKEVNIHCMLKDVSDRWQHLFDHIEARVNKLKETQAAVQQLDKNMSNLRSWLSRIEAELTMPVLYNICNGDEIQKRLEEQKAIPNIHVPLIQKHLCVQEVQQDIEQHTEGITSVLTLCDILLHDEDACSNNTENDSIQQTTHNLDQRWRSICSISLERKIRIEETWRMWCKFQADYSQFEDWLNLAEHTAAEPKSSDVLYTVAKEELKRYEAFQREVLEMLVQLEMINSQYRRLARENCTDSANRLRTMVHQGNQRWDALHQRVAAILRRLKHFTAQREDFEGTWKSLLVWLTEMDLQLTNVEHLSESDIEHKLKKLKGLKKKITQNTDKIDTLIVFGEGLIQRSAPLDAVLIEDELEELHSYCQEVFSRVGCFHQRLTSPQPLCTSESTAGLEDSDVAEPSQDTSTGQSSMSLLVPPQERSGCETPLSVDSIPLEWDHTGDVGGSSSHEEDDDASFFSCLSVPGQDVAAHSWHSQAVPVTIPYTLPDTKEHTPDLPQHESTPYKQGYVQLMSESSSSIKNVKKVSIILDDGEQQEDHGGLTSLSAAEKQSRVIERWELLQAQAVREEQCYSKDQKQLTSDLHDITSWLGQVIPELEKFQNEETACISVQIMEARVKQLKDMQKTFARYKTLMLSLNLGGRELQCETGPEVQQLKEDFCSMNRSWAEACVSLEEWEDNLRKSFMHCQEFHETLHSLLLWLAHAESTRFTVNINDPSVHPSMLHEHRAALMGLEEELNARQRRVSSLQEITTELLPESGPEDDFEATEKLHVIRNKLQLLLRQVKQDLQTVQERLDSPEALALGKEQDPESSSEEQTASRSSGATRLQNRDASPPRSFFYRVLRAAFPLHILFLLLLVFACLVPLSEEDYSCSLSNNFARSFYPMLRYTNGPPPT